MTTQRRHAALHHDHVGWPDPSTTVLLRRVLRPDADPAGLSRYADDVWHFDQGIFEESSKIISINFKLAPKPLREAVKHYMWVLVNTDPPMQLRRTTATRPSLYTVRMCWYPLRIFLNWLHKRRVARFCDVTAEMLDEYLVYLSRYQDSVGQMHRCVVEVRRLWGYRSVLPESMRLPETPPWGGDSAGALFGNVRSYMENLTPRINEDTMGALLLWALRFVEDFADDIIAAREEFVFLHARGPDVTAGHEPDRPRLPQGGAIKLVTDYAESVRQQQGLLPGRINDAGEREINYPFIGRLIGVPRLPRASYATARSALASCGLPIDDDAYLSTSVTATVAGRPWHPGRFSYNQTRYLVRHLHTAGLIVVAYLSGARPAEVLNLRRGCVDRDDANDMYLMSGVYFKNAVDEHGNKVPAGLPRADPWVVVAPVARAIAVLERLHDEDLLFTNRIDLSRNYVQRRTGGLAFNTQVATDSVHRFIDFVDQLCAHHRIDPIPSDSHGQLTISRFRRTLAWFIRRRPRGLVAASIQYGHVHTRMIQGYAGAYDSGFPDELAFEDYLARLEQFAADEQALSDGERVSGPASQTYRQRLSAANGRFAGYALTSKKQARDLLANPLLQIYHGEGMTCVFDATKAACQLRGARDDPLVTPDVDDCRPGCRNIARTDRDLETVRRHRDRLAEAVADRAAPPLRHQREQRELARVDMIIREHDEGH
ncbi:hypothetical protein A7G45_19345 [Mycolicibacterium llatzerense]|nr:hypothetical protein [Mycolicibacterium llatzerense]